MLNINISHLFIPNTNNTLLSDIRFQLSKGWTGIVGRNGSGKTTLAKSIAGIYFNYIGTITGNDDIYYLDQLDSKNEGELYEFLCDTSAEAGFWKSHLQIGWNHLENWEDLSFGERRRSQIALALYTRPRVIILDEPTNHLDKSSQIIIENALRNSFDGIGILISHNRKLLDQITTNILFIDAGRVNSYSGSYSSFCKQRQMEMKRAYKEYVLAKEGFEMIQKESRRRAKEADQAHSKRSGRKIGKNDHDARAKIRLAIVSGKDGQAGRLKSKYEKRLNDSSKKLSLAKENLPDKDLFFRSKKIEDIKKKKLFRREEGKLELAYIELNLPTFHITTSTKLGITGNNGSGKTSLLNYIYESIIVIDKANQYQDNTGSNNGLSYFIKQELSTDEKSKILEAVKIISKSKMAELTSILNYFHLSANSLFQNESFSPGEWKKIQIAWGILTEPLVWLMDEPTNHLDIPTVESLESVLMNWNRCLIIVSHDRVFIEKVCEDCLRLD